MKISVSLVLSLILLSLFTSGVYASLVVVNREGDIVWNVLSEEDVSLGVPRHSYLEVKKIAEVNSSDSSLVTLSKENGKVNLSVDSGNEKRQMDVTNWQEDIVEIEERSEVQKLKIKLDGEKFSLEQNGISATIDFPVTVDSKSAKLSVETMSGQKFLSILPREAVDAVLRTKLVNKIANPKIEITEANSQLQYVIPGEKVFDIFGLVQYSVPITSYISASTGEILSIDSPTWFKYIKFLFV